MIRLDTVNRSLQIVLAGAVTTNQLPITVGYSDKTATSYTGGTQLSLTNNTTAVTICSAPAASTIRDIDYVNIYNADTAAATVIVSYLDTATSYAQHDVTLQVDDTLTYTHAAGWIVTSKSGSSIQVTSIFGRTGAVTAQATDYAGVWRRIAQIVTTQVGAVATGTTTIPADNTIPQNTEGDQYMSLSITPTNVNSTLEIDVLWIGSNSAAAGNVLTTALFQDTTANALGANFLSLAGAALPDSLAIKYIMTAGTTSATTFKVRAGCSAAGTTTFNGASGSQFLGGVLESRITIKEYLP